MAQNAKMNYAEMKAKFPFTPSYLPTEAKTTLNTSPNRSRRRLALRQLKNNGGLSTIEKAIKARKERKRLNKVFRIASKTHNFLTRKK